MSLSSASVPQAAAAPSIDTCSPFERLDENSLRTLFRLVGNVPNNDRATQQYDYLELPERYEAPPSVRGLKTPRGLDLQSAAALACTSRTAALIWRRVQACELLDMLQAIVRGHCIRFALKCFEPFVKQAIRERYSAHPESAMAQGIAQLSGSVVDGTFAIIQKEKSPWNWWTLRECIEASGVDRTKLVHLAFTADGHIDLDATLENVERTLPLGSLPKRPRGWSNADCLLGAFGVDTFINSPTMQVSTHLLFGAVRPQFADDASTDVVLHKMVFERVRSRRPFGIDVATALQERDYPCDFQLLKLVLSPKDAKSVSSEPDDLASELFEHDSLKLWTYTSMTADMRTLLLLAHSDESNVAKQSPCLFARLRTHIARGVQPTLPSAFFDTTLLSCATSDLRDLPVETFDAAIAKIDDSIAQWPAFVCWKFIRTLGIALCPRYGGEHNAIKRCVGVAYDGMPFSSNIHGSEFSTEEDLWARYHLSTVLSALPQTNELRDTRQHQLSTKRGVDSLFAVGSSRFYHARFVKFSTHGVISIVDTLQRSIFRSAKLLQAYRNSTRTANDVQRMLMGGEYVMWTPANAEWMSFAVRHQLYLRTIAHEEIVSMKLPITPTSTQRVRTFVMSAHAQHVVDTNSSFGRTLDAMWQRVYESKHHERECRTICRLASAVPGPRYVLPTMALILALDDLSARTRTQPLVTKTPLFALSSEVHERRVHLVGGNRGGVDVEIQPKRHVASLAIDESVWAVLSQEPIMYFEPVPSQAFGVRKYIVKWSRISSQPWLHLLEHAPHEPHWWRETLAWLDADYQFTTQRFIESDSATREATLRKASTFDTVQQRTITLLEAMDDPVKFDDAFVIKLRCAACSTKPQRDGCQCAALNTKRLLDEKTKTQEAQISAKRIKN